jgi:hypothetical protein
MGKHCIFSTDGLALYFQDAETYRRFLEDEKRLFVKYYNEVRAAHGVWASNQGRFVPSAADLNDWDGKRMEQLRAAYPEAMTDHWQPIETAPLDGTLVDLWVRGPRNPGARCPDCWYENGRWKHDHGRDGVGSPEFYVGDLPTHWRPIPSGPS